MLVSQLSSTLPSSAGGGGKGSPSSPGKIIKIYILGLIWLIWFNILFRGWEHPSYCIMATPTIIGRLKVFSHNKLARTYLLARTLKACIQTVLCITPKNKIKIA